MAKSSSAPKTSEEHKDKYVPFVSPYLLLLLGFHRKQSAELTKSVGVAPT